MYYIKTMKNTDTHKKENIMKEISYEIISRDEDGDAIINFNYGGNSYTMPIDNDMPISADNDGSFTLDHRVIIEIDEENQILCIEE